MRPLVHTWIGYILIFIGLVSFILLCNSGGRLFDVGSEATFTRARLDAIDNITRSNHELIGQVIKEIEKNRELHKRTIEILDSRDALVIPKAP